MLTADELFVVNRAQADGNRATQPTSEASNRLFKTFY